MRTPLAATVAAATAIAAAAPAATLHDESVDGDLPAPDDGYLSLGPAPAPEASVLGTLDGGETFAPDGPDEADAFSIFMPGAWTMDGAVTGRDLLVNVFDTGGSFLFQGFVTGSESDIFGGPRPAGTYRFGAVPSENRGTSDYQLTVRQEVPAIPAPGGLALLLPALGGLALAARRGRA